MKRNKKMKNDIESLISIILERFPGSAITTVQQPCYKNPNNTIEVNGIKFIIADEILDDFTTDKPFRLEAEKAVYDLISLELKNPKKKFYTINKDGDTWRAN